MLRSLRSVVLAGLCLGAHHSCLAQTVSPQWFGTWQLDRSRSHLVGPSTTIGRVPHGYHFDFGAVSFSVRDDGSDSPTLGNRTTSIKQLGERRWSRVHKIAGKEVDHGTLTVSADGRTLLIHTITTSPDGATHTSDEASRRIGFGSGLAGTWRSNVAGINVTPVIAIADAGAGRILWSFPTEEQHYTAAPNGVPVQELGPRVPAAITIALRFVSGRELHWTELLNGKPLTEGIDRLAANGQFLTEVSWPVHTPADRQQAVYIRQ